MQGHTQCVTEHEKYALGATKPGGYAATGFAAEGGAKQGAEGEPPTGRRGLRCCAPPARCRRWAEQSGADACVPNCCCPELP